MRAAVALNIIDGKLSVVSNNFTTLHFEVINLPLKSAESHVAGENFERIVLIALHAGSQFQ
jgi:hypothetical protein